MGAEPVEGRGFVGAADQAGAWADEPLVIGATGGSGTRVFARILEHGGMFFGADRNRVEDSMPLSVFCDTWINVYASRDRLFDEREADSLESAMDRAFAAALTGHRGGDDASGQPWGWKVPTSIYVLPFFHRHFPRLRFLHVVRDGRDIAFSENQNQLIKHGLPYLSPEDRRLKRTIRSIALWSQANLAVASYAERELGDRYLRVRFEDLCADPLPVIDQILRFAGLAGNVEAIARLEVAAPSSIGRWRQQDDRLTRRLHRHGEQALRQFNYLAL